MAQRRDAALVHAHACVTRCDRCSTHERPTHEQPDAAVQLVYSRVHADGNRPVEVHRLAWCWRLLRALSVRAERTSNRR